MGLKNYKDDIINTIYNEDAYEFADKNSVCNLDALLKTLVKNGRLHPKRKLFCIFTSPPYWKLRDYTKGEDVKKVLFETDKTCKHEFVKYIQKGMTGGLNSSKLQTKGNENFQITCDDEAYVCKSCGSWLGNLGREPEPSLYINHLVQLFEMLKEYLDDMGTLWVNIGDSYIGSGGSNNYKEQYGGDSISSTEIEDQSLACIPQLLASEMVKHRWILRNSIIWKKGNVLPQPCKSKLTPSHELILFFSKSNTAKMWYNFVTMQSVSKKPIGTKGIEGKDWDWYTNDKGKTYKQSNWEAVKYFYNQQFDPLLFPTKKGSKFGGNKYPGTNVNAKLTGNDYDASKLIGKNKRDVIEIDEDYIVLDRLYFYELLKLAGVEYANKSDIWKINVKGFKGGHYATFPVELAELVFRTACPTRICSKCGLPVIPIYKKGDKLDGVQNYKGVAQKDYEENNVQNASDTKRRILDSLCERVELYTNCGCNAPYQTGLVYDPFMGSGTSFIAAKKLTLDVIGTEINKGYVNIAWKRILENWNPYGLW